MVAVPFDIIVIFCVVDFVNEPFFQKSKSCIEDYEEYCPKKPSNFGIKVILSVRVCFVI